MKEDPSKYGGENMTEGGTQHAPFYYYSLTEKIRESSVLCDYNTNMNN